MKNKKLVCLELNNKHLDALEDLLYAELGVTEKEKVTKQVKKLWHALVMAYDNKEIRSNSTKKVTL